MQVSLKHIFNTLENWSSQHYALSSFHAKEIKDLQANDLRYPLMWCQVDSNGMEIREGEVVFQIIVLILDRMHEDADVNKLLSDTACVIEDLITDLNDNIDLFDFNCEIKSTAKPVMDTFSDHVIGWRIPIKFKVISSKNESFVPRGEIQLVPNVPPGIRLLSEYTVEELKIGLTEEQIQGLFNGATVDGGTASTQFV
jgi:hypothetical protein